MPHRPVLWKICVKWVKAMVVEVIHESSVYSCPKSRRLTYSVQLNRSITSNHGEDRFRYGNSRERSRPTNDHTAHKQLQDGITVKEAVAKLMDRLNQGALVNSYDYHHVLKWCASERDLESAEQVHDVIKDSEMEQHPYVGTMVLKCYIECGRLETARETMNKLLKKDSVIWNMMISGLVKHNKAEGAIDIYKQMRNEGCSPSRATYLGVLKACASLTALDWGKKIHSHIVFDGFQADVQVCTALVHMYAKCGSIEDAKAVFDEMGGRHVVTWNVMIGGLAEHGLGQEAFSLFVQMQRKGFTPDAITYLSILNPSSSTGATHWVKEVHAHAARAGLDGDVRVLNSLIQMYAKTGFIADAKRVFDHSKNRDVWSWGMMIGGLAQHGQGREALEHYERMILEGIMPNEEAFVAVLSGCSHAGLVDEGRLHFESMRRDYGIEPALEHYTCMVDMLGRAGRLKEAKLLILGMPMKPDIVTWTALLSACKIHVNVELAELAAEECLKLRPRDPATYALLSNVYASVGNWDQVAVIRGMMEERGIRKDPGRCWIEVDNKVHEFLVGDTSHPESNEIFNMLTKLANKLKAEGYEADTQLVQQIFPEEDKEIPICSHSERLAIAYGLMHVSPGKPIRIFNNLRICSDCHAVTKLISKITGREIVARDVIRFHHFKDGSCSCDDYW